MAKVECEVDEVDLENDNGRKQPGVCVTCGRCGHTSKAFGTGDNSIKRALMMLREECPEDERNFYVEG